MLRDKAIEKVQKLLRLSKSANEHEAAQAAAYAQALMSKFQIEEAQLLADTSEKDEEVEDAVLALWGGKRVPWKGAVALGFAKANGVRVYWDRGMGPDGRWGATLRVIGRKSDAATVKYLTDFVIREIERLASENGRGRPVSWRNSFRYGAASVVARRVMDEARARREAERADPNMSTALVVIDRRAIKVREFADRLRLTSGRKASFSDYSGYAAGSRAGQNISLGGKAVAAIGAGSARLSS